MFLADKQLIMKGLIVFQKIRETVVFLYKQLKLKNCEKATGRPRVLQNQDVIALALYKNQQGIPSKKQVYNDFKLRCTYKTFNESINRLLPVIMRILVAIISLNRKNAHLIKYTDSTEIAVCLNKNAKYHRTMKVMSAWGRGSKGFYYGLKLHVTTDYDGRLLSLRFSSANMDDRKMFMKLNDKMNGLFVADAGYISQKLADEFYQEGKRLLMAKPKANMKKIAALWQHLLYNTRARVETLFNNTKKFRGLVSSLSRSIDGYLCNYVCALLAEVIA
jgi:hypothetical protein